MNIAMVCAGCSVTQEVEASRSLSAAEIPCPGCGAAMVYADPAAAAELIAKPAIRPAPPISAWRTIRREVLIGLAWGIALSLLVIYPLTVRGAYRDTEGRIIRNYVSIRWVEPGAGPPTRFELGWLEWLTLLVQECGPLVAFTGLIGLTVDYTKYLLRQPRQAA